MVNSASSHGNQSQPASPAHWLKNVPAVVHSIDAQGRLVFVSDAWLAKLGYAREEVLGRLSSDFLTPESRRRAIAEILPEFFRTGHCENVEYQMVCKDGRVIDVLMSAVLDDGGAERGPCSIAIITDVTVQKAAERQLAESELRYRRLVEDQSEFVSLATPGGELRFVNDAYARLHGMRPDEMVGRNLFDFVPAAQRAAVAEHFRRSCAVDHSVEDENQVVLPNGEARWVGWTNRALFDASGAFSAIHSVGRDIERRVAAEHRLRDNEARYRMLAEYSTDMILHLDLDLVRRYVSPACRDIFGYEPEELVGKKFGVSAHPEDADRLGQVIQSLLTGRVDRQALISRRRHRDGRWIWIEAQYRALKDPATGAPTGVIATIRDISARKAVEDQLAEAYRRLEAIAGEDGLTGLANRRQFDETFAEEFKRAQRGKRRLALLMIDVDYFKAFNDSYGHPAGDECLRRVGEAIRKAVFRPEDTVARYGGEEFAVLAPDTDETGAAIIGERIRHAVWQLSIEHAAGEHRVVTVSVGVASVGGREFERGAQSLLKDADFALYVAKAGDRNNVACASALPNVTRLAPLAAPRSAQGSY